MPITYQIPPKKNAVNQASSTLEGVEDLARIEAILTAVRDGISNAETQIKADAWADIAVASLSEAIDQLSYITGKINLWLARADKLEAAAREAANV